MSVSSSSWGLGRAAVCDCGTLWTFLLPFFLYIQIQRLKIVAIIIYLSFTYLIKAL